LSLISYDTVTRSDGAAVTYSGKGKHTEHSKPKNRTASGLQIGPKQNMEPRLVMLNRAA
jgi:hypothetical protein